MGYLSLPASPIADSSVEWLNRNGGLGMVSAILCPFGDKRLEKGGALLQAALVGRPGSCIKWLGDGRRNEMRFSRFLRHPAVNTAVIVAQANALTREYAAGRHVLAIQDTSELYLGGRSKASQGFGPVGKGGKARGVLLHAVLAIDACDGSLLGLVDAQLRNRSGGKRVGPRHQRTLAEKESQRWLNGAAAAGDILETAAQITVVSDREGDFYEAFAQKPANVQLLTRAHHNRRVETDKVEGGKLLFHLLGALPEACRIVVEIPAAPGRKKRTALLALRFTAVRMCAPKSGMPGASLKALPRTLDLSVVDVREVDAPEGVTPLHWRLVSTQPVISAEQAVGVLNLYRRRWMIEEYFRTLKTGAFNIEDCEISVPKALMNFVAAAAVAAVTIMQLVALLQGGCGARDGSVVPPFTRRG